jgi:hypothetical protein
VAVRADVANASVETAVSGAWAVANAVSLYVARGGLRFPSIHVDAAKRVATKARQVGAERSMTWL